MSSFHNRSLVSWIIKGAGVDIMPKFGFMCLWLMYSFLWQQERLKSQGRNSCVPMTSNSDTINFPCFGTFTASNIITCLGIWLSTRPCLGCMQICVARMGIFVILLVGYASFSTKQYISRVNGITIIRWPTEIIYLSRFTSMAVGTANNLIPRISNMARQDFYLHRALPSTQADN